MNNSNILNNNLIIKLYVFVLGVFIIIPSLFPLFSKSFFHMHDYTHVARLAEMVRALQDGHFPVRWSENLGFGYGLPQFNFYGPLPYYTGALFWWMGFSPIWSVKAVVILHFFLSFIAMYFLSRRWWGQYGGLISATAFIYIPYRAVDFYVRGAIGELTAITFIALTLWCVNEFIATSNRKWFIWLSLSVAGLVTSHNLTAFISLPFIGILTIVFWFFSNKKKNLKLLATTYASIILGLMLSGFYAVPALLEKDFTLVEKLTSGFSHYSHHFLYLRQFLHSKWGYGGSIYGPEDDMSFEIGKIQMLLSIGGLTVLLLRFFKNRNKTKELGVWLTTGALSFVAMLLATFKSQFIWDSFPLLAFVQFPWRFLAIIIVLISFISGSVGLALNSLNRKIAIVLTSIVLLCLVIFSFSWFKPKDYLVDNDSLYFTNPNRITDEMSGVIPDFMPKHQQTLPLLPPKDRFIFLYNEPIEPNRILVNRGHEFLLDVSRNLLRDKPDTITINIAYFPGWTIYIDGEKTNTNVNPQTGSMMIELPQKTGAMLVSGIFEESRVRLIANKITLISIAYLLLLSMSSLKINKANYAAKN